MTIAFQRMFGILERWNNNQVTPSLIKPHKLSYRSNSIRSEDSRNFFLKLRSGKSFRFVFSDESGRFSLISSLIGAVAFDVAFAIWGDWLCPPDDRSRFYRPVFPLFLWTVHAQVPGNIPTFPLVARRFSHREFGGGWREWGDNRWLNSSAFGVMPPDRKSYGHLSNGINRFKLLYFFKWL